MSRVADALAALRARLAGGSASAALDAELLVASVLGVGRATLAADPARELAPEQARLLESLARRRLAGEPVAYLTGVREFWSLELEVTRDVLVPRPETELLVERALAALADRRDPAVLDLGTGSGAIAIAIASCRPDAAVTATDASAAALAVARRNAERHRVARLRLLEGSWYAPIAGLRFEAIVSNPPYVASGDDALLSLAHEPAGALVSGPGGLEALAQVAAGALAHLSPGGALLVEHGTAQGAAVRGLMAEAGLESIETLRDLAGHERVTEGRRPREAVESPP
jgi:release factor glutamine methyltransferase